MSRMTERDRILPYTRAVAVVVLPFLLIASVLLYVLPGETDRLFAWTIEPPLTAMLLGSAYVGGIWFFVQVLRQRHWHRVRYGFPAVLVFSSLLGIATVLHWDRFHHGHISFITWATLYLTTPFLVLAAVLANRAADSRVPDRRDLLVPRVLRFALAALGMLALIAGATLFVAPGMVIGLWAWEVTPLTARVIGSLLTLPGMVNIWLLVDARWSAFRWMFQAQLLSLVFIAGALLIARDDLAWSRPAAPIFVAGIVASLLGYAAFYTWCERASRYRSGTS